MTSARQTVILVMATAAAAAVPAALAGGGTLVRLDGAAVIERKNLEVRAAESMPLYSGDVLNVGRHASAQIRFEDDSVYVVPGAARLRVDQFRMSAAGGAGTAVFTLLEGGVRTLTGRVGRNAGDRYELRTEEATITVAGTAFLAIRCQGACARKYKAGLYLRGESGTVFLANAAGRLKLHRGQTAYVASNTSLATHVKVSPFDDPRLTADYGISGDFDAEVHPPRIEQERRASPS
jgi:hypothetical protein